MDPGCRYLRCRNSWRINDMVNASNECAERSVYIYIGQKAMDSTWFPSLNIISMIDWYFDILIRGLLLLPFKSMYISLQIRKESLVLGQPQLRSNLIPSLPASKEYIKLVLSICDSKNSYFLSTLFSLVSAPRFCISSFCFIICYMVPAITPKSYIICSNFFRNTCNKR